MPIAIGPFPDEYRLLNDVNIASRADQDVFKWDSGSGKFVHSTFVSSFNARTGAVSLTSLDVTTALGFTPRDSAATTVNTFNTRSGTVTLISGDVTSALGYTPRDAAASTVNTFNTRSGTVTLISGDVTTALGFTPVAIGGSDTQLLRNNAGAIGGVSGATSNGTYVSFGTATIRVVDLFDTTGTYSVFSNVIANSNLSLGAAAGNQVGVSGIFNTALGQVALGALTTGTENVAVGTSALGTLTTGGASLGRNTAVGTFAGINVVTGAFNVAIGRGALNAAAGSSASQNCAVGYNSLLRVTSAQDNIALGTLALDHVTTGGQNVAIGTTAGSALVTGSGNILIGYRAGEAETGSNKLYIANSQTATPLIGGDFNASTVTITGALTVSGLLKTGSGPVTLTDASGNFLAAALNAGYGFTLSGTATKTYTFPTTDATLARTDIGQTFTGTNAFGIITATSLNGNTFTTGTYTLTGSAGKVLTFSNTITLTAADGSTLAIGGGGTLGTAAYTSSGAYQPIDAELTVISSLGSSLQQLRVNVGGTAIEYFTPAASGLTVGTTAVGSGSAGRVLYETSSNVLGEITGATSDGTTLTLVAPVLGTPASGTLTNATGLPPAGVVGTAAILGANTFTGVQTLTPGARSSGVVPYLKITTPADTGQTLNTEFPGIVFGGNASNTTVIRTGADGTTYALQREYIFVHPTYAFAGATTITDAATVAITGCPIVGTNATITRRAALLIDAAANDTWISLQYAGSEYVRFGLGISGYGMFTGAGISASLAGFAVGASPTIYTTATWSVATGSATFITGSNASDTVATLTINSVGLTTKPGLQVNMTASQTANPIQVKDSAAVVLFQVGPTGQVLCGTKDAGTITITNGLTLYHRSTGTAAAGLGSAILFNLDSSTTADQNAAQIAALWTTATHASRTADLVFYTVNNAAALAEGARLTGVKDFSVVGKISTADPTSGTGPLWKLGTKKTAVAVTISPTDYVEIDIAGVVYKLGIVA